jgi:hypothetical protein
MMLYFSPFGSKNLSREYRITFTILAEADPSGIYQYFNEKTQDLRLLRVANGKRGDRFEYFITLQKDVDKDQFYNELKTLEGIANVRLDRSDNLDKL